MNRSAAILLIGVLLLHAFGTFPIWEALIGLHKKQMEAAIERESELPAEKVRVFALGDASRKDAPLQWIDEQEFRYEGALYDVIRTVEKSGQRYLVAYRDREEERMEDSRDRMRRIRHNEKDGAPLTETHRIPVLPLDYLKDHPTLLPPPHETLGKKNLPMSRDPSGQNARPPEAPPPCLG